MFRSIGLASIAGVAATGIGAGGKEALVVAQERLSERPNRFTAALTVCRDTDRYSAAPEMLPARAKALAKIRLSSIGLLPMLCSLLYIFRMCKHRKEDDFVRLLFAAKGETSH